MTASATDRPVQPRISLVIPCYRDAATLARALDSVLMQTRPVDEVIVVNDCSPETAEIEAILSAYPSVRYIRNEKNIGLAATRNVGVRAAQGEIVCFLDADDELHPQKTEFQLRVYHPDRAVTCQVERIGDGVGTATVRTYGPDSPVKEYADSKKLIRRNRLTGAAMMISRERLLSIGGYDDDLRSCEDFDLWLRLLDAGVKVIKVQRPLYLYRMNAAGLSRNLSAISQWEIRVVEGYLRRHASGFLENAADAKIWCFWILKHIMRFEICREPALQMAIRANIARVRHHRGFAFALTAIERLHLLRPVAWLLRAWK